MANSTFFGSSLSIVALLAACGNWACSGKVVDLGSNPAGSGASAGPIYSTSVPFAGTSGAADAGATPFPIVDKEDSFCSAGEFQSPAFTVSFGRLFWASNSQYTSGTHVSIRSCLVDHCASSFTTCGEYDVPNQAVCGSTMRSFQVDTRSNNDALYWSDQYNMGAQFLSCSTVEQSGDHSISFPGSVSGQYAIDNGFLYVATSENAILQCDVSDCANTLRRFLMTAPDGEQPFSLASVVAQDLDYLYLYEGYVPSARIVRVLKQDPSAAFEVVTHLDRFVSIGGFFEHGGSLYWIENILMGELRSCAKTGCSDKPTTLMTGLNWPNSLAVDDLSVYVLEPPNPRPLDAGITGPNGGRVLRCPITGCTSPDIIFSKTNEVAMGGLQVDDRFVYFSASTCAISNFDSTQFAYDGCVYIAAIPK